MPAARTRDAQVVAALGRRLAEADPITLSNLAWFAARRGEVAAALEQVRRSVALPGAPRAAWRAIERLAAGRTDGMLLASSASAPAPAAAARHPLAAAVAAHQQSDLAVAEVFYRAAQEVPALAGAAWNGLAVLHEQRRERSAADNAWERSVAAGSVAGRHNQALAMLRRGFPHRARALLAAVVVRDDAPAMLQFLAGYAALADQDPAVATELLARSVARDPESARAHFTLGLAAERLGRHADALSAIRRALLLSPWYLPQVWLLESGLDNEIVELPAAQDESMAAADDVLLSLGRSLLQTGHLGEALAVFDQVLTQQPARPAALFHRGVVLAKLRRYGEALEDWEQVDRADPASDLADASRRHARSARQLASLFAGA